MNRLLVVDHRRPLLGVLAAADLLAIFGRSDFGRSDVTVMADLEAGLKPVTAGAVQVDVSAGSAGSGVRRRPDLDAWWAGRRHSRTDRAPMRRDLRTRPNGRTV